LDECGEGVRGERATTWFGRDGKVMVQVLAAEWPSARKQLDQYFKGTNTVGGVKAFREARKEMPTQTSLLGLIDSVQLFGSLAEAFKPLLANAQAPLPPNWPNKPAKGTTAFIGLSVTLQPQRGGLHTFIPAPAA